MLIKTTSRAIILRVGSLVDVNDEIFLKHFLIVNRVKLAWLINQQLKGKVYMFWMIFCLIESPKLNLWYGTVKGLKWIHF